MARDDALLQEEMAAPLRGKSPSPLLDAMAARGTRDQASGRRLLTLHPRMLLFPKERQPLHLRVEPSTEVRLGANKWISELMLRPAATFALSRRGHETARLN